MKLWLARFRLWLQTRIAATDPTPIACPSCGSLDLIAPPREERIVRVWIGSGMAEQRVGRQYYCAQCRMPLPIVRGGRVIGQAGAAADARAARDVDLSMLDQARWRGVQP